MQGLKLLAGAILLVCSWENRQVKGSSYSARHASGLLGGSHGDGVSGHGPLCASCLSNGVSMAMEKGSRVCSHAETWASRGQGRKELAWGALAGDAGREGKGPFDWASQEEKWACKTK